MAHIWIFQALGAAVMWGLGYALTERLFKIGLNPYFVLVVLSVVSVIFYLPFAGWLNGMQKNLSIITGNKMTFVWLSISILSFVVGNVLIFMAIMDKGAAMANIIEISFPIFTVFFAWILFRDVSLNWAHILGGILIFCGATLVYWKG